MSQIAIECHLVLVHWDEFNNLNTLRSVATPSQLT